MAAIQPSCRDQAEHSVAEELEPLVVSWELLLVGGGTMNPGGFERRAVLELVAEALLEGRLATALRRTAGHRSSCHQPLLPNRRSRSRSSILRTIGLPCGQAKGSSQAKSSSINDSISAADSAWCILTAALHAVLAA